jgi:rhodanese-related sulfurtransferase
MARFRRRNIASDFFKLTENPMNKILSALLAALLLAAAPVRAELIDIDNAKLRELLASGVPLVDIRTAPEWKQTGVVPGSHLLTFFDEQGRYDARAWVDGLSKIAKASEPVIIICRTGNRTGTVGRFLDQQVKYAKVYNVREGIVGWMKAGNATDKAH